MKTIEVSDEMYDALMALSNEINSQDHRGTAMPYIIQVYEKERITGIDSDYDTDGYFWFGSDCTDEVEPNVDDMKEALMDLHDVIFDKGEEGEGISEEDLEELMEQHNYHKIYYNYQDVFRNAFFTAKACKEHIESNKHHYNENVKNSLNHTFRNPEMRLVMEFLCGLTGRKLHL